MEASAKLVAAPPIQLDKSRLDLAMRAYTIACARVLAAQAEQEQAFREYFDARQRLEDDHKITSDLEMKPGMAAAFSVFKQDLGRAEALRMASQDMHTAT